MCFFLKFLRMLHNFKNVKTLLKSSGNLQKLSLQIPVEVFPDKISKITCNNSQQLIINQI